MKVTAKIARHPGGSYCAWCPSLPGCAVYGITKEQAMRRLRQAVDGYVDHIEQTLPRELHRMKNHRDSYRTVRL